MAIERIKWVIIIILFLVDVAVFYVGYTMGKASVDVVTIDQDKTNSHRCDDESR